MAKKKHKQGAQLYSSVDLRERIDRAANEGRYQQALELAKQLAKYEPTPEHQELLRQTYLGRARQLRTSGYYRDAASILNVAAQLPGVPPAYLQTIAQELALCGDTKQTAVLVNQLPADSPDRLKLQASMVDSAVRQGHAAKGTLPEELQADFERVLQAARQVELGQDEAAKETLQPIGLRSPFLEWKMCLRGLSAYYQGDDLRAIENWQRLNVDRIPFRIVAPYRFQFDSNYRQSQPPRAHPALQQQFERLQGPTIGRRMRDLQPALADEHSMSRAYRIAEEVVPLLRQQAGHLIPRLAVCFYGAMIDHGTAEDEAKYRRLFGSPPDDPNFLRLRARSSEVHGDMVEAHRFWQQYDSWVAMNQKVWKPEEAKRVRALIWNHMGNNAASVPIIDEDMIPPFLRNHPERPRPLKPGAEECYRKSLELAPDQLDTHMELLQLYLGEEKLPQAERTARQLLVHHPKHVPTLQKLANLRVQAQDYVEGIAFLERALQANPLDRRLRSRLSTVHLFQARSAMEADRFDEARAGFNTSLSYSNTGDLGAIYCKMAACEFKAGDSPKAEEFLQKALQTQPHDRLSIAYSILIEVIRLKLPGKLKTRFNKEFNAELAKPAVGASAASLAVISAAHKTAGVTYHGQKTHETKVTNYLKKATRVNFSEEELTALCPALLAMKAPRTLAQVFLEMGSRKFPKNPFFPLWEIDVAMMPGQGRFAHYRLRPALERARALIQAMPPGSEKEQMMQELHQREETLGGGMLSPFGGLGGFMDAFENLFGGGGGMPFMDFDEDEDDDDDDDGTW